MITENVSTLKIHKLTQAQYDRELAAGSLDQNALYLTPDEEIDLSPYAVKEEVNATYETKEDATAKLAEAKLYADTAATTIKNDLLNGAGEAYDTLKELGTLIDENVDAIEALETVATNKADKEHTHTVSEITDYVEPVQADWNQTDETANDYIKNKTHYDDRYTEEIDNGFNFTFDGNLEGKEYHELAPDDLYLVKLSDAPLTEEQIIGCSITEYGFNPIVVENITDDNDAYISVLVGNATLLSVFEEVPNFMGGNLKIGVGLWITFIKSINNYLSQVSKTDIQTVEHGELKQLDEKFIPDTISREGHVHSYNDLTDRTHYEEEKMGYLFEFDSDEGNTPPSNHNGTCTMVQDSGYRFINGETYTIETVDEYGVEISVDVVCNNFELVTYPVNSQGETMYKYKLYQWEDESNTTIYGEFDSWINSGGRSMLKLYGRLRYELKQLDEKYIPDTIARKEYVDSIIPSSAEVGQFLNVKSIDENGKPTEWECVDLPVATDEDVLSLISDLGYAHPAASSNNEVYMSNDGAYYII